MTTSVLNTDASPLSLPPTLQRIRQRLQQLHRTQLPPQPKVQHDDADTTRTNSCCTDEIPAEELQRDILSYCREWRQRWHDCVTNYRTSGSSTDDENESKDHSTGHQNLHTNSDNNRSNIDTIMKHEAPSEWKSQYRKYTQYHMALYTLEQELQSFQPLLLQFQFQLEAGVSVVPRSEKHDPAATTTATTTAMAVQDEFDQCHDMLRTTIRSTTLHQSTHPSRTNNSSNGIGNHVGVPFLFYKYRYQQQQQKEGQETKTVPLPNESISSNDNAVARSSPNENINGSNTSSANTNDNHHNYNTCHHTIHPMPLSSSSIMIENCVHHIIRVDPNGTIQYQERQPPYRFNSIVRPTPDTATRTNCNYHDNTCSGVSDRAPTKEPMTSPTIVLRNLQHCSIQL